MHRQIMKFFAALRIVLPAETNAVASLARLRSSLPTAPIIASAPPQQHDDDQQEDDDAPEHEPMVAAAAADDFHQLVGTVWHGAQTAVLATPGRQLIVRP